jgi:hypothetical protein
MPADPYAKTRFRQAAKQADEDMRHDSSPERGGYTSFEA